MSRQYVAARFKHSARAYTFHNDGDPLQPGDFVEAMSRGSIKIVEVVEVVDEMPEFPTNAIMGKVDRPESWPIEEAKAPAAEPELPTFD